MTAFAGKPGSYVCDLPLSKQVHGCQASKVLRINHRLGERLRIFLLNRLLIFALRQHHVAGIRRATGLAGIAYAIIHGFFTRHVQAGAPGQAALAGSG